MQWRLRNLWPVLATPAFIIQSFAADILASKTPVPILTPIYRLKLANGEQRLATKVQAELQKLPIDQPAFYAIVTNDWLSGLAPIFAVERTNHTQLRRRAPRGQENFTEPFFFALPPTDEPNAAKLIGRWDCRATREGSKPSPSFELTLEGERVSGRFDQNTDYRFAFITGGTFKSNRLQLHVEYIKEVYLLTGAWHKGILKGEWRRTDDIENGTWEASRPLATPHLIRQETVALYEWRRSTDGAYRYAVESEQLDSTWTRSPRPLCRVWLPDS